MGDRFATIDMGRKVWDCSAPFRGGSWVPSNMSPGPRLTSVPSGILSHPTVWPQYTNVTDRQTGQRSRSIRRTVTCKAPFTRYNLLLNPLSNRLSNRAMFVYTIQPVVKLVVNPVVKPGCTTRFDNRLNEQWLFVQHGCQTGCTVCQTRCTTGLTTGCIV